MDGDTETCEESALALEEGGYHVLTAVNAAQGIVLVMTRAPAVIVADISDPYTDGWKPCEFVRSHLPSPTPPDDPHQLVNIIGKVLAEPIP